MPSSILVIHGMTQVSEWYLEDLKKSEVLIASKAQLKLVDFGYGANPGPVISALDSGDHSAAIVCDLSTEQSKFMALLGTAVKRFVYDRAGRLAFPTTEGLLLNPVLKALFEVPWTEAAYYRTTWGPRPDTAARMDETFPIRKFLPEATAASALTYSAKACSYLNVPKEDRCYGVTEDSQHESLSMAMAGAPAPGVGERTAEDPYGESEKSHVSVAMRKCGDGKICYFGDVNAEKSTTNLVIAFCLA